MQDTDECLFCVVDLHAITQRQEPAELLRQTREMAAALIACGLSPDQCVLFVQSHVPAHAQLAWVFNCIARLGWLNRMTQFKDKAGKDREAASTGLYVYPNLMAADILVYHATQVPVGDDQRQHLELANDIAEKFNHDYGVDFFPRIEPLIQGVAARVMSLRDGTRKMSKSDPSDQSRINLNDDADTIANKIKRATTDPELLPDNLAALEKRPEARNLVGILAAITGQTQEAVLAEHAGRGFGTFKPVLTEALVAHLGPIRTDMLRLLEDPGALDAALHQGAEKAEAIAAPILKRAYEIVGFLPRR